MQRVSIHSRQQFAPGNTLKTPQLTRSQRRTYALICMEACLSDVPLLEDSRPAQALELANLINFYRSLGAYIPIVLYSGSDQ